MNNETFWISDDGIITSSRSKRNGQTIALVVTFKLRNAADAEIARQRLSKLQFSERSSIARIGIEIYSSSAPRINRDRLVLDCEAFVYDTSFPCAAYFRKLLVNGTPVGRLFYAPESQKLSSNEIWQALQENRIKLPDTTSIDRFGKFAIPCRRT